MKNIDKIRKQFIYEVNGRCLPFRTAISEAANVFGLSVRDMTKIIIDDKESLDLVKRIAEENKDYDAQKVVVAVKTIEENTSENLIDFWKQMDEETDINIWTCEETGEIRATAYRIDQNGQTDVSKPKELF